MGYIEVIYRLFKDNGKENGSYYLGFRLSYISRHRWDLHARSPLPPHVLPKHACIPTVTTVFFETPHYSSVSLQP